MKSFLLDKFLGYSSSDSNSSKKEFYKRFILQQDVQSICDLINQVSSNSIYVEKRIQTRNFNFGDSSFNVLLKVGWPKTTLDYKFHNFHHKIWVYKSTFHDVLSYTNCHFLNDRLFFIHICFPETLHVDKNISRTIEKKYDCIINETEFNFLLFNAQNDKLLSNKDVYLNLYYISGDREFSNLLHQHLSYLEKSKINKKTTYSNYLEKLL